MMDKWIRIAIDGQFREVVWSKLSSAERLAACQQLENSLANERGAVPRQIVSTPMNGKAFGSQSGKRIYVNSNILERNAFYTINGFEKIPAAGWQMYDTICHEDLHGMQEDMGTGQTFTYVSPEKNYDLYRIQHDEKYAYAIGQYRTLSAIIEQKEIYGLEPDMIAYKNEAKKDRYQDKVDEAARELGIPEIDKELERLIEDKENGRMPLNPSNGYLELDNILYGAHHNLNTTGEEGEQGEAPIHQGISINTRMSLGHEGDSDKAQNTTDQQDVLGILQKEETLTKQPLSYNSLMNAENNTSSEEFQNASFNQIAYGVSQHEVTQHEEEITKQPLSFNALMSTTNEASSKEAQNMTNNQVNSSGLQDEIHQTHQSGRLR